MRWFHEACICYCLVFVIVFFMKCFSFFDVNNWLFWHFCTYILIPKQNSLLRKSNQAANLMEKIRDFDIFDSLLC